MAHTCSRPGNPKRADRLPVIRLTTRQSRAVAGSGATRALRAEPGHGTASQGGWWERGTRVPAPFCILRALGFGCRNAEEKQRAGAGKAPRAVQLPGCVAAAVAAGTPPRAARASRPPAPRAWGAATLKSSFPHPFSDRSLLSWPSVGVTCSGLCPSPVGAGTDLACRAQPQMPGGAAGAACLSCL